MESKDYKKIVNKLVSTIEKNGIPEKLKKWKKPTLKYNFDSYDDFHTYIFRLAKSYDKHSFIIDHQMEEEYIKNNKEVVPKNKKPDIKILKNDILYIKFYQYINIYSRDWKKDLEKWVRDVKPKIDKFLEKKLNGIIIDLSKQRGGNMWPPIRVMDNIYGKTTLLRFNSEKNWLNMINGKEKAGKFISKDLKFIKKITVIISEDTASSGELIAATFKGRKNTFFVGDKTNKSRGFMSANNGYYIDKNKNLKLILTISLIETVDKKIHTLEYLKARSSDNPIKTSIDILNRS